MTLETLQTFDRSDVWTKRQQRKIQKDKKTKDKKTTKEKDKTTKRQKDKRQSPKRVFNIATSGQFRTIAMFFFINLNDPSTLP